MSPNNRERGEESAESSSAWRGKFDATSRGWPHVLHRHDADASLDPIARMEWLDDLMFAAIDGDPAALDCAGDAWRKSLHDLGAPALEESRQQYLRRAQSVWNSLRNEPNHPPHKVFAAIEIISLLARKSR